jgi:hypothetical protein
MKLSATVREAVADAQVAVSQEEAAQAGSGAPGPRTRQDGRAEQPDVHSGQRTYDHAIREFVTWAVQSLVSHSTAPSCLVPDADLFTFELRRKTSGSRAPSEPDNLAIPRPPNRRSFCCYPHRILQGSS